MSRKLRKELIGHVGVDSGQLMIVDPCYVDSHWVKEEFAGDHGSNTFSYNGACQTTVNRQFGELVIGMTSAVVFSSGYGDGVYPVYGYFNEDNRIVKVTIIMG
jgi:hypothetical protein